MKDTLSPAEVAGLLGVSKTTVLRLIHAGDLRAVKVSPRVIKIRLDDLQDFLLTNSK